MMGRPKKQKAEPTHTLGLVVLKNENGETEAAAPVRVDRTLTPQELAEFRADRAELRAAAAEEKLAAVMWDAATSNRMMDATRLQQARVQAENACRARLKMIRDTFALGEGNFDVDVSTGTIRQHPSKES